ncbi:protein kinase domain-containing protein [Streptomyces bicolor]|uniref:protein kinase domain-containing protein n=1 Tax=Streptomyces bicolor TaxID=66874 RepID=UPI0005626385|nr:serine/threonine-protein kinase [Streptomyces bicolor]
MGRVWRAVDEILDRLVAVKEMRIDGLDPEDTRTRRERTLREARATARIDHPHVVRVYDVVDEGERLWIVMELVAGRSLERIVAEEGPLGPCETARIGMGLVAALRQVHARGVLHRDIKPGNVLVEAEAQAASGRGRVVLTDFGIAAIQDAKALTMVGMLVGSPDYMAPERVSGRPQGPPSDIWSLGATLSAALAGRSPFSRDTTLATLHAVLYEEPELPPTAGPLRGVLAALLDKDPSARPGLDDLETALQPVAFPAPVPTMPVLGGVVGEFREPVEGRGQGEPGSGEPGQREPVRGGPVRGEPASAEAPELRPEPRPAPQPDQGSAIELERMDNLTHETEPTPDPPTTAALNPTPQPTPHPEPTPAIPAPQPPPTETPTPALLPTPPTLTPRDPRRPDDAVHDAIPPQPSITKPAPSSTSSAPRSSSTTNPSTTPPSSTEPPSEPRSEARSHPPAAHHPGSPTPRRPGVSLSRADAVTERRPAPEPEFLPGAARPYHPMPPGELPGPPVPAEPRRGRRRTGRVAVAVGVVAAGAVVAVVLATNLGSPGGKEAGSSASASAESSPGAGPSSTVEGTSRPQSLPPGSRREAGGFAWVPPEGWRRDVKTGSEVHYTSPDGKQELAAKSSLARDDLMDSWRKSEKNAQQGQQYRKIRLERTTFRGHPAVVWEYTFTLQGAPWHAQLLGFTMDGKSYQINTWYQPDIEAEALRTYEKVKDGFTVL